MFPNLEHFRNGREHVATMSCHFLFRQGSVLPSFIYWGGKMHKIKIKFTFSKENRTMLVEKRR